MKTKIVLVAALLLAGSKLFAQDKVADTMVTVNPNVSNFDKLKIEGPVDIVITQGQTESLKLTFPVAVQNRVVAEVSGRTLRIHNKHDNWGNSEKSWYSDKSYWRRSHARIVAVLTVKNLNHITMSGSGTMAFDNGLTSDEMKLTLRGSGGIHGKIATKDLATKISGSGKIEISGSADKSVVNVTGSGNFIAPGLVTANSSVRISGSGDAKVNANEGLSAAVTGSGGVSYTGSATKISSNTSGSGHISRF